MRAIALAALVSTGCSYALVRRAGPDPEPRVWPHCTEHKVFPLIDTAYAALAVAMTVALANDKDEFAGLGLIVSVPMALGFGSSAWYGWSGTAHCSAVREAYEHAAEQGR